jgi:predicted transcriptional regulator of viral defense system
MVEHYNLKIYDIEKTVCDIIKYRMKIGLDTCKEIVRNYLQRDDRNLSKISEYAQKMNLTGGVTNIIIAQ